MNRFLCKAEKDGSVIMGYYLEDRFGKSYIVNYDGETSPKLTPVDKNCVHRFTGLQDCNGDNIYADDLLALYKYDILNKKYVVKGIVEVFDDKTSFSTEIYDNLVCEYGLVEDYYNLIDVDQTYCIKRIGVSSDAKNIENAYTWFYEQ